MKLNYLLISLITFIILNTTCVKTTYSKPEIKNKVVELRILSKEEKANKLMSRLKEIQAMNISKMSMAERNAIRSELRELKKEFKQVGGGIYLSATAIIIILVALLILT